MERALRIAMVSEHASPAALLGGADAGGQNVYLDELSRGLGALGHRVDVFTRRDSRDAPAVNEWAPGVRIVNLAAGPPEPLPKDELWPLMPEFRDALLRFAGGNRAEYDLLHGNFWMSGWVVARLREQLGAPAVQIFHATGLTKRRHQGEADTSPDERVAVERGVVRQVDALIAQCPSERDELVEDYAADPLRVALIPSAVNVERFRPVPRAEARRRIGLAGDELVVAYIGRMLPRKDVRNVVRALPLLREADRPVRLLLVGGETAEPDARITPEIGVLRSLAAELGVADRVTFVGRRQPDELRHYYGAADVVVTTPWYEPFGLTPLEAMACGRPVIGSAVGGITFTIAHGETGLHVPPSDPPALARALDQLLARPELREAMGRAARERVEREFTWATVARRTAALYQSLVEGSGVRLPSAAVGRRV
jgi:D-inositol-3-phosphate glycosyltransferase